MACSVLFIVSRLFGICDLETLDVVFQAVPSQARTADLAAGMVFVNGNVTSYSQLPFGGIRSSGHGRELSYHGIREFCNVKSVWIGA